MSSPTSLRTTAVRPCWIRGRCSSGCWTGWPRWATPPRSASSSSSICSTRTARRSSDDIHAYSLENANALDPLLSDLYETLSAFTRLEGIQTEYGPGQVETNLVYTDALEAADDSARLKYAAKEVARRHGKIASFMPKPFSEHSGSSAAPAHLAVARRRARLRAGRRRRERAGAARDRGAARAPAVDHAVRRALGQRVPAVRTRLVRARDRDVEPRQPQRRGPLADRSRRPTATRIELRSGASDANPYWLIASALAAVVAGLEATAHRTAARRRQPLRRGHPAARIAGRGNRAGHPGRHHPGDPGRRLGARLRRHRPQRVGSSTRTRSATGNAGATWPARDRTAVRGVGAGIRQPRRPPSSARRAGRELPPHPRPAAARRAGRVRLDPVGTARHPSEQYRRRRARDVVDASGAGRGHLPHRVDRRGQAAAVQPVGVRQDRRQHRRHRRRAGWPSTSSPAGSCRSWRRSASTRSTTTTAMPTRGNGSESSPDLWAGKHVAIGDRGGQPALDPARYPRSPAMLYVGGESEPGRALAAEHARCLLHQRPPARRHRARSSRTCAPDRGTGAPLRFGLSAFVIARETEAEALAELEHLQSLVDAESRPEISGGTDPEDPDVQGAVRHQAHRLERRHAGGPGRQLRPGDRAHRRRSTTPESSCSCSSSSRSRPSWTGSRTRSSPISDERLGADMTSHT